MVALLVVDGGFSEDLIDVCLRADAHVLLAERLDVGLDVRILLQSAYQPSSSHNLRCTSAAPVRSRDIEDEDENADDLRAAPPEGSSGASSCGQRPRPSPAATPP